MTCLLCGADRHLLVNETWAGSFHSACTHGACEGCVSQWVESQLPKCRQEAHLRVQCYAPGCCKLLPQKLVFHASETANSLALEIDAQQGEASGIPPIKHAETCDYDWSQWLELSKLKNLAARAECRIVIASAGYQGPERGGKASTWRSQLESAQRIQCDCCGEAAAALITHPRCGHSACVHCWVRRAEAQLDEVGLNEMHDLRCVCAECPHSMSWLILRYLCARFSEKVRYYVAVNDAVFQSEEKTRLRKEGLPCEVFQRCAVCQEPCELLPTNRRCGHAACMSCWQHWVESCAPTYLAECRRRVRCFAPGCKETLPTNSPLWQHLCERSQVAQLFLERTSSAESHFATFQATTWSNWPFEPGPTCPICQERCWALLQNSSCGHAACEKCWPLWAASDLDQLLATHSIIGRCFSHGCNAPITKFLWQQCCTHSQEVQEFSRHPMVTARARLRANPLYPGPMQVDCPRPDCWGLGYLGFDRVMCFICEHQWQPEEPGNAPEDVDVEIVMGVRVKKCPKCNEYIEKNGGCDHMTCRCKHEFRWSTLAPYR